MCVIELWGALGRRHWGPVGRHRFVYWGHPDPDTHPDSHSDAHANKVTHTLSEPDPDTHARPPPT